MEKMKESAESEKKTRQHVSGQKGGLRTMPFIIANEAFDKISSVGLAANMILYLISQYHLDNATGASILLVWGAIAHFMPMFAAFFSDSYSGRFPVIAYGSVISLLGHTLLWLTAVLHQARPPHCDNPFAPDCGKPHAGQLSILFLALVLMAVGAGGIRACSIAFAADQFDKPDNPNNERVLQTLFNWYYASVAISILISITVIVYIMKKAGWPIGFGIPAALMLFAAVMFFLGTKFYIKAKPKKSLIIGLGRVVAVAWKNKHLALPPANADKGCYYHTKNSRITFPTERLRFLNKACIIRNPEKDLNPDGSAAEPWNLCTAEQVEELKAIFKVIPIWSTGIAVAVVIQQHTFAVLQAGTLDRRFIGNFEIPEASFGVFGILTLTIWVALYDRILVPIISKYTKNPRGLSFQQRMGIGLFLACVGTAVAALVERKRRAAAIDQGLAEHPLQVVNMSAMWLIPQHCIVGLAEAFNAIAQIEFYYSQFPRSMHSIGTSMFSMGMAVGNLVGVVIVQIVKNASGRGGKISWLSNNLNLGHYDYFYWILTIMCVVNFFYYIFCSWAYGPSDDLWDNREEEMIKSEESLVFESAKSSKDSPIFVSA